LLVSEVLGNYHPAALRLALAGVHYRSMLEYADSTLDDATATWGRLSGFVLRASDRVGAVTAQQVQEAELPEPFVTAMDDDLSVPRAFAHIHETVRAGNAALTAGDDKAASAALLAVRAMLDVLGLDPASDQWRDESSASGALVALDFLVRADIDARAEARSNKDWAAADAIRDRLSGAGIVIEDSADGARWSLAADD
jgi:cysteinyl-tRNA synthetase